MAVSINPYFQTDQAPEVPQTIPFPSVDIDTPAGIIGKHLPNKVTPLLEISEHFPELGASSIYVKDETGRMGLGSFKALGAAYVLAYEAAQSGNEDISQALAGRTYVTASAGNHGLSVAFGARQFGAKAVIFLAETVPSAFADRLRAIGAEVRVEGADYGASFEAARRAETEEGFIMLSDISWDGYYEMPHRLMEGYLVSANEVVEQMPKPPTHIFLQAGVGGLAGAFAAYFRKVWGIAPIITVVEPDIALALKASIEAGKSVYTEGPVSNMGRLDCKEPSLIAFRGLARDANYFLTVSDEVADLATQKLSEVGIDTTPSGAGGFAALFSGDQLEVLNLDQDSTVLCIISEGAE